MLIPLVCPSGEVVEWALVELQGRVEQQLDIEPGAPLPIGTLQLAPASKDVVQMQIGYHMIEGKKVPLKKPLAILERRGGADAAGGSGSDSQGGGAGGAAAAGAGPGSSGMECDGDSGGGSGGAADGSCEYEVIGVVRHKYLFKNRPRAMISKPAGRGAAG